MTLGTIEMAKPIESLLLKRQEAAALIGFSVRTLEYKSARGEVPGFCKPFGGVARWNRQKLEIWCRDGCPEMRKGTQLENQASTAENESGESGT